MCVHLCVCTRVSLFVLYMLYVCTMRAISFYCTCYMFVLYVLYVCTVRAVCMYMGACQRVNLGLARTVFSTVYDRIFGDFFFQRYHVYTVIYIWFWPALLKLRSGN